MAEWKWSEAFYKGDWNGNHYKSYYLKDNYIYVLWSYKRTTMLVCRFNLLTRKWEEINRTLNSNEDFSTSKVIEYNDSLFFFHPNYRDSDGGTALTRYNLTTNTTKVLSEWFLRSDSRGIVSRDNYLYLLGGDYKWHDEIKYTLGSTGVDMSNEMLITSPDLLSPRANFTPVIYDNKLYCPGGRTGHANNAVTYAQKMIVYDFNVGAWHEEPGLNTPREVYSCVAYNGYIYVLGGYVGSGKTSSVEIYDINKKEWSYGAPLPENALIGNSTAFVYESKIIYMGAINRSYSGVTSWYESVLSLDLAQTTIGNPSPISGYINEKNSSRFSWELETYPPGMPQQSAVFQWREKNAGTINTISVGTEKYIDVPAYTFPNGEIEWRVKATANNVESPFTPWHTISTIDAIPLAPTGLYPANSVINGTRAFTLYWIHNSPLSTEQSAYEVQVAPDGINFTGFSGKVISGESRHNVNAKSIFPINTNGKIAWRVRTYNSDDMASPWSESVYLTIVTGAMPPAWISVEVGKARPLCKWLSDEQVSYQLQVLNGETVFYDSGEMHGADKGHKLKDFLADGVYSFRLRIKNALRMWSEWVEYNAVINTETVFNIDLQGSATNNAINLQWTTEPHEYLTYYVIRDGIAIAKTSLASYTDYTACGNHVYKVRGVNPDGNFKDSGELNLFLGLDYITLAPVREPSNITIINVRRKEKPKKARDLSSNMVPVYLEGRRNPVFFDTKNRTENIQISNTSITQENYSSLYDLWERGETLIYRDSFDKAYYVKFLSFPADDIFRRRLGRINVAIDFSASLAVVDYSEEVEYD